MPRTRLKSTGKLHHEPLLVQLNEDQEFSRFGKRKKLRTEKCHDDSDGSPSDSETILDSRTSQRILDLAQAQQDESDNASMSDGDDEIIADPVEEDLEEEPENIRSATMATMREVRQDFKKPDPALGLDPKVVDAYTKLGKFLHKYKSGPLPKLFKVLPTLRAWARILALTRPENWSPHACRAATRIFISNMKPEQAQLFLKVVLLDAIREDIRENKKLDPQYYESLRRALYKPAAFFKGVIFPMLEQGCTLKEAAIIASVMARTKIPVLHSSAAILRIAGMDYTGANSLLLRVLIDKKYELPYKVVDELVFHFIRLSNTHKAKTPGDPDKLPVLWHQSLLAFVQRYSPDLTLDQRSALLDVINATPHPQIGPEVRREITSTRPRAAPGEVVEDVQMS